MSMFSMFSNDLGVDLGTSNVLIYTDGTGLTVKEPGEGNIIKLIFFGTRIHFRVSFILVPPMESVDVYGGAWYNIAQKMVKVKKYGNSQIYAKTM